MYNFFVKRLFDFVASCILVVLVSPVFLLLIVALAVVNNGKPFFGQLRPGRGEKLILVLKFRTMNEKRDKDGRLLSDEHRLTRFGKFVRKTSLDELPQLISVLKGDMSLVGPRPLLVEYLPLYSKKQHRRHEVRPGLTGWAQIHGRNRLAWPLRFDLDVWYVDNISLRLDLKIIFITFFKVLKAEGVSSRTSLTMENFKGNPTE